MLKLVAVILFVVVCIAVTALVIVQSRMMDSKLVEKTDVISTSAEAETLVLLLHAFTRSGESLNDVETVLREHYQTAGVDIIKPDLPIGMFPIAANADILAELVVAVDTAWQNKANNGTPYKRIILIGHSYGSLLARKLYAIVNGEPPTISFERELYESFGISTENLSAIGGEKQSGQDSGFYRPWSGAVERIILFAGMNRGWSISHHMSITRAISHQLGVGLSYVIEMFSGSAPNIMSIRKGAPFITQLRLQWLEMEKMLAKNHAVNPSDIERSALTIQMLGSIDDLVSPDDNIDLVTGGNFKYLDVPYSGHASVINLIDGQNPKHAQARKNVFIEALERSPDSVSNGDSFYTTAPPDDSVTDVVFVIHGIRDLGHWTKKIARRVVSLAELEDERKVQNETSSYGYFPMLSFLVPGARQEKVQWLMDRYTEARARYPNADFHYVGHSHGTYLLAKALEDYRSVNFKHVVFAGSVVRKHYDWDTCLQNGQIKKVQNFVATADWVVGIFPKALQTLKLQDLGSAGHDGFDSAQLTNDVYQPEEFVVGGHSAALQEDMWELIASFVLTGDFQSPPGSLVEPSRNWWVVGLSTIAPLILIGIVVLVGWGLYTLLKLDTSSIREWQKTVMVLAYIGFVWLVITRV